MCLSPKEYSLTSTKHWSWTQKYILQNHHSYLPFLVPKYLAKSGFWVFLLHKHHLSVSKLKFLHITAVFWPQKTGAQVFLCSTVQSREQWALAKLLLPVTFREAMLWAGSASCVHKPKERCLLLVLKCSFLVHPPHHKTLDSSHFKPNSLHSIQIRGKGSFSNTPKRRVLLVQDSHIHTNYENSELSLNVEKLQSWEAETANN